jgi:uncharacterized membrane protein
VSHASVLVTTFLAACVEVIEMVIIVVGVGTVRGWRSTWLGAAPAWPSWRCWSWRRGRR